MKSSLKKLFFYDVVKRKLFTSSLIKFDLFKQQLAVKMLSKEMHKGTLSEPPALDLSAELTEEALVLEMVQTGDV